jgi:HD-GYP domain-containing protein (c-di-GMP phosphodiesterase class II)
VGARIIQHINGTAGVTDIVLAHHEKFDGGGYPNGMVGESIPVEARILTVADAFDAMTSTRPYRRIFAKDEVVEEFQKKAGSHFDASVVSVFLSLYKADRIYVPELIYVGQAMDTAQGPRSAAFSLRRSGPPGAEPKPELPPTRPAN